MIEFLGQLEMRSVKRGICRIGTLYLMRFTLVSYDFLQPMFVSNSNINLKISTFESRGKRSSDFHSKETRSYFSGSNPLCKIS